MKNIKTKKTKASSLMESLPTIDGSKESLLVNKFFK